MQLKEANLFNLSENQYPWVVGQKFCLPSSFIMDSKCRNRDYAMLIAKAVHKRYEKETNSNQLKCMHERVRETQSVGYNCH